MGKLKKTGIGIGIAIAGFFVLVIAVAATSPNGNQTEVSAPEPHQLTFEEIKTMSLDSVPYDDLMRYNENYVGKFVHYQGPILQVENIYGDTYILRIGTSGGFGLYDDVIWVN
jgi:hypothetical protein